MFTWNRWTLICFTCIPLATTISTFAEAGQVQVFVQGQRPGGLPPQPDSMRITYYKGPNPAYSDTTLPDHWSPLRALTPGNWILTIQNVTTGEFLPPETFTVGASDPPKRGYVYIDPATSDLVFHWIRIVFAKDFAESTIDSAESAAK